MSAFFNSLKSDLFDRRVTPVLALLGVALLAAIVYAVLGGGGSSFACAGRERTGGGAEDLGDRGHRGRGDEDVGR